MSTQQEQPGGGDVNERARLVVGARLFRGAADKGLALIEVERTNADEVCLTIDGGGVAVYFSRAAAEEIAGQLLDRVKEPWHA